MASGFESFTLKLGYRAVGEPVSILLPVCNEADGIESVVAELVEVVYRYLPVGSEFLIEEGGSTDGTKDILRHMSARWPFLKVNYADRKEGFAAAARKLYQRATCPLVFFTDSDGQCVASEFWRLVPGIERHQFVLGIKRTRHDPHLRRVLSRCFNWLARRLFHFCYHDINFGFRLCRRDSAVAVLDQCREMPTMLNAEAAILAHLGGYQMTEVLVHHRPRLYGKTRGFAGPILREAARAFFALARIYSMTAASGGFASGVSHGGAPAIGGDAAGRSTRD